ncbi:MAG: tryptophan 7-halogenase [Alphaproteobacteria bacterium]|nr:MAG: tryptophan 7-halogenase [Alphaproteobacteria bacterium]
MLQTVSDKAIRSILIVGGGTAGWMTAAALARFVDPAVCKVTLIESDDIGTVGVGEASVPLLRQFNGVLGIDERDFIRAVGGTFKLGIEFRGWGGPDQSYFHGFGDFGDDIEGIAPHHHWLKLHRMGDTSNISAYSLPHALASRGRFAPPEMLGGNADYNYAFHFDAGLYARFLRAYAEQRQVKRLEGRITDVALDGETGHIVAVTTADGTRHEADFFVDCSGFSGLLIEGALKTGYQDWRHWLPCDRAVVVATEADAAPASHTVSTAQEAGWQWRIPLQHRTGNGYVYASPYMDDDKARETLLANGTGRALGEPRLLKFMTGRRNRFWNGNCVAVGLSGGFMEPLESTSIQLIQTAIVRLIEHFPDRDFSAVLADEYNRLAVSEFERIRDFLILHYHLAGREDGPLWDHCRRMDVPETLQHKIEVFRATGKVPMLSEESYQEASWVSIFLGNGFLPDRYDPLIDRIDPVRLKAGMQARRDAIARTADAVGSHQAFIQRFCPARVA